MHYFTRLIFTASLGMTLAFAGTSLGSTPSRYSRTYLTDYLKNHPLQLVTGTHFTLKNSKGLLIGDWRITLRDIRTDEVVSAEATGICKKRPAHKIECIFDATSGSVNITPRKNAILLSIPVGQGVQFYEENPEANRSVFLLGTDDDNNLFKLDSI